MTTSPITAAKSYVNNTDRRLQTDMRDLSNRRTGSSGEKGNAARVAAVSAAAHKNHGPGLWLENGDGDNVMISGATLDLRKKAQAADQGDTAAHRELVKAVAREVQDMHREMIRRFVESITGKSHERKTDNPSAPESAQEEEIPGLPEYWNAENTSQRIVDFALSFSGVSGLEDGQFIERIREAIKEGFNQARSILGELPGPVGRLVDRTFDLTMKKLDAIADQHAGKTPGSPEAVLQ